MRSAKHWRWAPPGYITSWSINSFSLNSLGFWGRPPFSHACLRHSPNFAAVEDYQEEYITYMMQTIDWYGIQSSLQSVWREHSSSWVIPRSSSVSDIPVWRSNYPTWQKEILSEQNILLLYLDRRWWTSEKVQGWFHKIQMVFAWFTILPEQNSN